MAEFVKMQTLHIAIIDPVGQKAGLDHYDLSLAKALINKSCDVNVYSNFKNDFHKSFIKDHFQFTFRKKRIIVFKEYISALFHARTSNADIVILHLFHSSFIDLIYICLAKLFRFRVCLIVHDVESLIDGRKKSWISKCINLCYCAVVHNKFAFDELVKKINRGDEKKIFVIPHGNFIEIAIKEDGRKSAEYFNLDHNKIYILFFGMIKKSKGLDILIDAMKSTPDNVHLLIAGRIRDVSAVQYETLIEKLNLSSRIHSFIRYITNEERNRLFNIADVTVLPYRRIYQSGVLLMSMSYGVPVIASDHPSNKEIINGKNGMLFNTGDSSDLSAKINLLISDEANRKAMADCAREYVSKNHDWEKIGDLYINILK